MSNLLYQLDSYLKEFDAQIVEVNEDLHGIVLDQTALYIGGGGQPADKGVISWEGGQADVTTTKRVDGQYVHILAGDDPLPATGTAVHGQVDWERRYKLMRTHTAMHILCGVVFPGLWRPGDWRQYGTAGRTYGF